MKPVYYYTITIIFWAIILIGSTFIPSVDEIFEIIGVVCVNCIAFLFPGVFYLVASKRYHEKHGRAATLAKFEPGEEYIPRNKVLEFCAYLQILGGICALIAGLYNKIN